MKTQTTISIDLDLAERINRFAKVHDISKSFIHTTAVTEWLDRQGGCR